jgi:hypothetical protein
MMRRAASVLIAAAAVTAVAAAPAAAAPDWNYGLPEELFETTCLGIVDGSGRTELGTSLRAGMFIDSENIPKVGEVFYGAVSIGAAGGCVAKAAQPEVIPPEGVELAVSAANPVRCHFFIGEDNSDTPIVDSCPQNPRPGPMGGLSLSPNGDPDNVWIDIGKIPGTTDNLTRPRLEILYIEFPLRASRPLTGLPGGPSCAARASRTGPCPAASAGDFLQVPTKLFVLGGTPVLTPAVGLTVEPSAGAAPGPQSPATGLVTAPSSVRIGAAVRGIAVRVAVPASGARVTATLRAPGIGRIAVVRRSGVRAGRLALRLRPTRAAARRLRQATSVTATLRVTVRVPGQAPRTETSRIRLRR